MKNNFGLLIFCGGCADLMPLSTYLCKKKNNNNNNNNNNNIFIKNWEIWELFVSSTAI